jgi:hypothetical protein
MLDIKGFVTVLLHSFNIPLIYCKYAGEAERMRLSEFKEG